MVKSKSFVLIRKFVGEPEETDFGCVEEELPPLQNNEFVTEALYWSVDPYMRVRAADIPLGSVMIGRQIARVLESKNDDYKPGDHVFGNFGWRTHTIVQDGVFQEMEKLMDYEGLPVSLGLGVLGRPGQTAYFGFLELCAPKPGETVVVTGAAGAVGSHVGQIAKILGCKVIGFAGTDKKVDWLKKELNFDHAFNYKTTPDVAAVLTESAPEGVDCYFDNVGGTISSTVLRHMNLRGRIAVCGSISGYNQPEPPLAPYVQRAMINKQLRMEGFQVMRWKSRFQDANHQNLKWIKEGKLKYMETIRDGFSEMPKAFIGLFRGENTGKIIVKNSA